MLLPKPILLAAITCMACAVGAPSGRGASVKIIGGVPAKPEEFPYLVSIQVKFTNPRDHVCGGTLVDMTHVVTAASCLQYLHYSYFAVVAGSFYHSEAIQGLEQFRDVKSIIFHPAFDKLNPQYNDVAVVELTKPFNETSKVRALPFAKSNQLTSDLCTIVGWGQTEESGADMSEKQRKANVTVNSISECKEFYPTDFDENFQLCAGGIREMAGPCMGDDGGPLLCRDVNSNYVFVGISSWGKGCENEKQFAPAVYMEVAKYRSWLDSVIHG